MFQNNLNKLSRNQYTTHNSCLYFNLKIQYENILHLQMHTSMAHVTQHLEGTYPFKALFEKRKYDMRVWATICGCRWAQVRRDIYFFNKQRPAGVGGVRMSATVQNSVSFQESMLSSFGYKYLNFFSWMKF